MALIPAAVSFIHHWNSGHPPPPPSPCAEGGGLRELRDTSSHSHCGRYECPTKNLGRGGGALRENFRGTFESPALRNTSSGSRNCETLQLSRIARHFDYLAKRETSTISQCERPYHSWHFFWTLCTEIQNSPQIRSMIFFQSLGQIYHNTPSQYHISSRKFFRQEIFHKYSKSFQTKISERENSKSSKSFQSGISD